MQKLSTLSLDRTPAAEVLTSAAMTWYEAAIDGRAWDEARDTERVRKAFRTLVATMRRWPVPAEFLAALPPLPEPLAIGKDHKPASPAARAAAVAKVNALLRQAVEPMPEARVERQTTPEQREAIEAELRAHYASGANP